VDLNKSPWTRTRTGT